MHDGDSDKKAVVTTIGKYLRRHFSEAPDELIRDIAAKYTYGGDIAIVNTTEQMVSAVINGPRSCMSSSFDIRCDDGIKRHPYAVYAPDLGWSMAVRREDGDVMGRCLLWQDPDNADTKVWVRSYKRERDYSSHSGTDEAIEAFLRGLGYVKHREWPRGAPLERHEVSGGYLMPYIDGGTQSVDESDFVIAYNGELSCSTTSGLVNTDRCTCDECGASVDEDEITNTGYHEDHAVCNNCIDDYTYVIGRNGNQYYVPDSEAVYVRGDNYHVDWLSDNDIVELADGDYEQRDRAVYVDSEDAYYSECDSDICYAEDTEQHELKDNCWRCTETNNWYTDDTESVEVDGELYHPDDAPEPAQDELELIVITDATETN